MSDVAAVATASERAEREKRGSTERARVIKEEERRRTRKEVEERKTGGALERRGRYDDEGKRVLVVNRCVRCTLFPSPMSEPCLGYFRDISSFARIREREREEKKEREKERDRETVHAYVRTLSRRECHRSISRGGWNFWPSRGVSKRETERERERESKIGRKRRRMGERVRENLRVEGENEGEEREGDDDGRTGRYHT